MEQGISAFERLDALYASVEDSAALGVWEWRAASGLVRWSPGLFRIYGVKPESFSPTLERYLGLVVPEDRERVRAAIERAVRDRTPFSHEERVVRADGAVRSIRTWGRPIVGSGLRPEGLVGVCQDVTEAAAAREQAERAEASLQARLERESARLAYQAALLVALQEASPDGVLVVDEAGRIVARNRRFLEIWGIPERVVADGSDASALDFVREKLARPDEFEERVRWLYAHPDERAVDAVALRDGRVLERHSSLVADARRRYGRVWFFRERTGAGG